MKNKERKIKSHSTTVSPSSPPPRPKKKIHKKKQSKLRVTSKVLDIWEREKAFIENIFNLLPKNYEDSDEAIKDYLLDLSDSEETKKREKFELKTKKALKASGLLDGEEEDGGSINGDATSEEPVIKKKKEIAASAKPSREELLERLHAKIALVAQKVKDPEKSKAKREKKVKKKNDRKKDSKKQFTSKTNPNLKGSKTSAVSTASIVPKTSVEPKTASSETEKTPLRKSSVKKSDGQVVYSKFDFIHANNHEKAKKQKTTDLLKNAEKAEGKIARLEAIGKKSEAVKVAESQKWISAIKRAQGEKVRDDPELLKKTIKKEKKLKEVKKKKWKERVDNVEKQKELKVKKRTANIQARKDDKKKKLKKIQRKKGRLV